MRTEDRDLGPPLICKSCIVAYMYLWIGIGGMSPIAREMVSAGMLGFLRRRTLNVFSVQAVDSGPRTRSVQL